MVNLTASENPNPHAPDQSRQINVRGLPGFHWLSKRFEHPSLKGRKTVCNDANAPVKFLTGGGKSVGRGWLTPPPKRHVEQCFPILRCRLSAKELSSLTRPFKGRFYYSSKEVMSGLLPTQRHRRGDPLPGVVRVYSPGDPPFAEPVEETVSATDQFPTYTHTPEEIAAAENQRRYHNRHPGKL